MKLNDIRVLALNELNAELARLRQALFHARMQAATRQLKKVSIIRILKGDIAKILTVIREKRYE